MFAGSTSHGGSNGMAYATQFHPEHQYDNVNEKNSEHQIAWLNNFIELAIMHHDFRVNNDPHPTMYFSIIQERLDECLSGVSSQAEDL